MSAPLTLENVINSETGRELWIQWNPDFDSDSRQHNIYKIKFFKNYYRQYFYSTNASTAYYYQWYGYRFVAWKHEPNKEERESIIWIDSEIDQETIDSGFGGEITKQYVDRKQQIDKCKKCWMATYTGSVWYCPLPYCER